jgi:hypothetical protein
LEYPVFENDGVLFLVDRTCGKLRGAPRCCLRVV